jgi:signal transduction histidine kinase
LKVFSSSELIISELAAITAGRSDDELRGDVSLFKRLRTVNEKMPNIQSVWVINAAGRPVITNIVYPAPDFSLADRDYFAALSKSTLPLHVGQVYRPKIPTNPPFFSITGRRVLPDGRFNGVINVSLLPTDFEQLYEEFARANGGDYVMVRDDGAVLASYPDRAGQGRSLPITQPDNTLGSAFRTGLISGQLTETDGSGTPPRRLFWRRLGPYPVYLIAGAETGAIRRAWLLAMSGTLLFGLSAAVILSTTLIMARRSAVRFYDEVDRRRAAEEALRQSQRMEVIGQLTGGVAHDFNNLLAVVLGNLGLVVRRASLADPDRKLLEAAVKAGQRVAVLTQRLLAFARKQDLAARPVDVDALIRNMSELLVRSAGAAIEVDVKPYPGTAVAQVDPGQLELAILNLVVNARDASSDGGRIAITTDRVSVRDGKNADLKPGEYVAIGVSDSGRGMDAATLARAAEPFFTTKEVGKGTGLGLSMVQGFAMQSGGKLLLESEPGKGTRAQIFLPASHEEPRPVQPETRSDHVPGHHGAGLKVLVVDDDPLVLMGTAAMVEDLGHEAVSAGSAARAIEIVRTMDADVVLTDYTMPGMTGSQLAAQIRLIKPGLPIVLATGHADVPSGDSGPLERLTKPYTLDALAQAISRATA